MGLYLAPCFVFFLVPTFSKLARIGKEFGRLEMRKGVVMSDPSVMSRFSDFILASGLIKPPSGIRFSKVSMGVKHQLVAPFAVGMIKEVILGEQSAFFPGRNCCLNGERSMLRGVRMVVGNGAAIRFWRDICEGIIQWRIQWRRKLLMVVGKGELMRNDLPDKWVLEDDGEGYRLIMMGRIEISSDYGGGNAPMKLNLAKRGVDSGVIHVHYVLVDEDELHLLILIWCGVRSQDQ
ncbi:hypothetical protein VNO77_44147 [Canavalia gladiata]|uniref:Uncharacterized protein n=1 Tax=Canavalia gladiata TaxID=3824 RepID=A0AAN9JXI8_CANGL